MTRLRRTATSMQSLDESASTQLLPHLDAAYNLARWLTQDEHDAEDVVQESYMRAHRRFSTFKGGNGRAWLLTIVRNCSYDLLKRNGARNLECEFDEEVHAVSPIRTPDPEVAIIGHERTALVRNALADLPTEQREILVLREIEELSYREIASAMNIPLGTVMSRLSRARIQLQSNLVGQVDSARTCVSKLDPKEAI
jgi:RNA polymerase sigma-70 factor (ECF subfamily)